MSNIIYRFSLDAVKTTTSVSLLLLFIWLVVVGCAVASIRAQKFSARQKFFWSMMVIFVPVAGLLSYLPFAVCKENYPGLFPEKKRS